jgi:5-methylthioadenosine/S-adenosylhomocysteine deaminase
MRAGICSRPTRRSHPTLIRTASLALAAALVCIAGTGLRSARAADAFDPARGIVIKGTVVTMDDACRVIEHGHVLVRDGRIAAVWSGPHAPSGVAVGDAVEVDLGPKGLVFPGLMNLHDHPAYNVLPPWPAPSSHRQPAVGRTAGTEPYANRYQWNTPGLLPAEYRRLVQNPNDILTSPLGLDLLAEALKYAEVMSALGGETTNQGAPVNAAADGVLVRNAESPNFGRNRIRSRVPAVTQPSFLSSLNGATGLRTQMRAGAVDAWLAHVAEGVPDAARRFGDSASSRAEFATLKSAGLLTDVTVIVHGVGLEPEDFAEMRAAPSIRTDGAGDGLGAKLVWSPLSNLLLYGTTARVYHALQAGVLVSLGADWTPSGSKNLLGEMKVADVALRDPALLGRDRHLVTAFAVEGRRGDAARDAEVALDREIVKMATRNPAKTLRWDAEVGSIERGKVADLVLITEPKLSPRRGRVKSPYRALIDATEQDVRLVLVGGEPVCGDVDVMERLKPGDHETITSARCRFTKAVDVTREGVVKGDQTYAAFSQALADGLAACGGDAPPVEGGQAADSNTYSYFKARFAGGTLAEMPDADFRTAVLTPFFGLAGGRLNLEKIQMTPVLLEDDDFFFVLVGAVADTITGLPADATPPFKLYPANFNHAPSGVDPFAPSLFEHRWYGCPCHGSGEDR